MNAGGTLRQIIFVLFTEEKRFSSIFLIRLPAGKW